VVGAFSDALGAANGKATINSASWINSYEFHVGEVGGDMAVGLLTLLNDGFVQAPEAFVSPSGTIVGQGTIQANLSSEGNIAPGVVVEEGMKQVEMSRTLTIDGNLTIDGGRLEIPVSGLAAGEYGMLDVSGTVDIQNSTIQFQFAEGYLPQMGDQIPFLVAGTALTIDDNTILQYEGAAEGFLYNVSAKGGMLMFKAMNNAVAEVGGEGEGEGEGEGGGSPTACPLPSGAKSSSSFASADFLLLLGLLGTFAYSYRRRR